MKKTQAYIFLLCSAFFLGLGSNTYAQKTYKLKISKPTTRSIVDSRRIKTAELVRASQANCCEGQNCGLNNDYCSSNCKPVVLNCHKVSLDTFNILTNNMSEGHATFPKEQIEDVLNGAVCGSEWIRCYIRKRWLFPDYFRIGKLPHHEPEGLDYETFYSVALLQEIYDKQINSIVLFRGTKIDSNEYVIPFMVNYTDGTVGYYDVSDLFP